MRNTIWFPPHQNLSILIQKAIRSWDKSVISLHTRKYWFFERFPFCIKIWIYCDTVKKDDAFTHEGFGVQNHPYHPLKPCSIDPARGVRIKNMSGHPKSRPGCRERPLSKSPRNFFFVTQILESHNNTVSRSRISVSSPGPWVLSGALARAREPSKLRPDRTDFRIHVVI